MNLTGVMKVWWPCIKHTRLKSPLIRGLVSKQHQQSKLWNGDTVYESPDANFLMYMSLFRKYGNLESIDDSNSI